MKHRTWNPPQWLVWYGYAWSAVWGLPARVPAYADAKPNELRQYLGADFDQAYARFLADEVGH